MVKTVATTLNPYQGLKRHSECLEVFGAFVATTLNPYQGLKRRATGTSTSPTLKLVATTLNPYQGLKLNITSQNIQTLMLQRH